ncbi:chromosomal replication initiator protein DnaA [Ancylobacter sp. FA202]|uniref:chromosomal replication initiator protein DnaA n=1 Tax=Ancylobacter sp. FA202 TaxID=1111106 RepID=UPI0003659130|nr:chromosomal replication initiator protein DnaA [Ancylobacter sp. FA202]
MLIDAGDALPPGVTDAAGLMRHYKELRARMLGQKVRPRLVALRAAAPGASLMDGVQAGAPALPLPVLADAGSPLDPRLSFARFQAGDCNRVAQACAWHVAQAQDGAPRFNPLVLHGGAGLGKTHLLQATVGEAREAGRAALYLSAEAFLVRAMEGAGLRRFLDGLGGIALLAIDDVQGVRSRTAQAALLRVMQDMAGAGHHLVLAMDAAPGDAELADERLASRLGGGLAIELGAMDPPTRRAVLEARANEMAAEAPGFALPAEVLAYVVECCGASGRQLEGALNRLLAHSGMGVAPVTLDMAETALRDLKRCEQAPVRVDTVIRVVARHYKVEVADILSQRRTANVVKPRQIAMYLAKTLTPRSLPEVGRRFAGRDHTTVLHAVRKIDKLIATDAALAAEVQALVSAIRGAR